MAKMDAPVLLTSPWERECRCRRHCKCTKPVIGEEIEPEELAEYPRVFAVDPGDSTGWGVLWFDPDMLYSDGAIGRSCVAWWCGLCLGPELEQVDGLCQFLRMVGVGGEGLAIVVEDFIPRAQFQDRSFLSPVRLTAMFRYALWRGNRESDGEVRRRRIAAVQSPSDAKSVITDGRLRSMEQYLAGSDHPRDAMRHANLWIRRLRQKGESFYDSTHFTG